MDLFSNLKSFFKVDTTTIDNNIFRLHYKATAVILVGFSILVTGRQYLGDPIDCMTTKCNIRENLLDTFCWVHTTFSLPAHWEKKVGVEVSYPGIGPQKPGDPVVYHAYYQWVCFVLFLQALMFYIPRYFWKCMEKKRIKSLVLGLDCPVIAEEVKDKNKKLIVEYLVANFNNHNMYFFLYVAAEVMNFVNVVGQIFLMDVFLGGEFSKYGTEVLQFTGWDGSVRYDPMVKVFPRMTKCEFHSGGMTGNIENCDALCILPINIINEKIYIFLWFWFIILAVLSGLVLVYRAIIIFYPDSRFLIIRSRNKYAKPHYLESIVKRMQIGDWLLFDLLSKNIDPLHFRGIVDDLSKRLDAKYLDYEAC